MRKPNKLRHVLREWLELSQRFEKGLISENVFLRTQIALAEKASFMQPIIPEEASAQLMMVVLIWKEETGDSELPLHVAMDKMLGHVMDFLQVIKSANH